MDKATGSLAVHLPDVPAGALLLDDAAMDEGVAEVLCLLFGVECLSVGHFGSFLNAERILESESGQNNRRICRLFHLQIL